MKYGSLFAGYGGLDMGVSSVLSGEPAWFSEIDKAPSKILAHHWPTVPNLGDITEIDWDTVEPVDVLTGGFPCQDVSHAGKRLGLKPGTRSGLWSHMAYAIDKLRPRLVVAENVRGLLSAEAGGDLEPCPWCVGDGEGSPLRALGAVLGDLVDLGYNAQWHGVRASDAGAPHGRFRVFVYAWPRATEHAPGARLQGSAVGRIQPSLLGAGRRGLGDVPDTSGERHGCGVHPRNVGPVDREDAEGSRERERAREVPRDRSAETPTDTLGGRRAGWAHDTVGRPFHGASAAGSGAGHRPEVTWGDYEPAIRRWESLTRPAPAPTELGKTGAARLSPAFVEWLMGLPAGHVTGVPGLSRNDQLKALGNGVVPQQAALATRAFLATHTKESAA